MPTFYSHAIERDDGTKEGSKILKNHLSEVGGVLRELIAKKQYNNLNLSPEIGYLIGITHDFGKYTSYFQNYLLRNEKGASLRHHHGFLSAIFSAYIIDKLIPDSTYLSLIAYFIVLHHHGDLNALELDVIREKDLKAKGYPNIPEPLRSRLETLEFQLKDLQNNLPAIDKEYTELLKLCVTEEIEINDFLTCWKEVFAKIHKLQYQLLECEKEVTRLKYFIITLLLYSLLIDVDKKDAADVRTVERKEIPGDLVDRYRKKSLNIDTEATAGINGIRNEIYENVVKKISAVPLSNHIFTFTAPTGTGKTLSALSCALKLRERLKKGKGYEPRIIYSLPFTSIIDQNYEIFKNVLKQLPDFENSENAYLIKHHHLSDLKYKIEDEQRPLSEALLLIESWQSEVIVTTFIQLLHSIIGFKNRFLKKFHNIAGSIILLDEVQNIPIEYWPLVRNAFKVMADYLGCYVILLTATKPLIFDEGEGISLIENSRDYFKRVELDRVIIKPDVEARTIDEFFQKFKSELYDNSKSYLIVLNTIKSSIKLYEKIKEDECFKELIQKKKLFYISTNIVPKERSARIDKIKKLLDNEEKIVVVSTQVVEAGIDIDLDIVIRDIGPIDSIIQVAGRCNREKRADRKNVYVFNLKDDYSYATYVYGSTHYSISYDFLKGKNIVESEFFDNANQYFAIVSQKKNQQDSADIWDAVKDFRFYHHNMKSISNFELIKEKGGYVDVFVEIDKKAKEVLEKYIEEVISEKDFRKRQANYLSMRKDFKSYIISVPRKLTTGLESITEDFLKVPHNQLNTYYDISTGYKGIEDSSLIF